MLLAFLIGHKNVFEEPWGTNINLAADYGTIPLQEGHELSQSFQSEGQHLDQLFLWIEGAASADGTLLVRLDDENGTLVTQSVAMVDYAEDVAKVWVPMDEDLKKGKSYTVTLNYERTAANGGNHVQADAASAGDPGEAQGVIYFRSSGSFISGAGIYLLAGGICRRQLGKCQQKLWPLQYFVVFSVLRGHLCGDRPGGLGGSHCEPGVSGVGGCELFRAPVPGQAGASLGTESSEDSGNRGRWV